MWNMYSSHMHSGLSNLVAYDGTYGWHHQRHASSLFAARQSFVVKRQLSVLEVQSESSFEI